MLADSTRTILTIEKEPPTDRRSRGSYRLKDVRTATHARLSTPSEASMAPA